ncbi:MAG: RNA polymerase sigma factor [Deltaproteobacteria bacterium]|nr:RNA polymerase sigma factor [Deltaproteobacteria bacterium]
MSESEDRELRRRFHDGDRHAFASLVAPHIDTLYTLCLRMTGSRVEAEDLAQDAIVRAIQQHRAYDPNRPFRPWLLTVTANLCRDRVRSTWWQRVVEMVRAPVALSADAEDMALGEEREACVRRALGTLPAMYREALSLYHLEDMSYAEMVVITGVSESALKQRVRRGTQMLEVALRRLYPELHLGRTVSEGS